MFWMLLGLCVFALTLPGTVELLLLTLGGVLLPNPAHRNAPAVRQINQFAVVVPAHNEACNIAACVQSLLACEPPQAQWRIVVVADNCSDETASVAEQAGASVWVRSNEQERGKGYALNFAFEKLLAEGVDAVLIVDADTAVDSNFLQVAEQAFNQGADAVQSRYTVKNVDDSFRTHLLQVALLAFNVLRPRGREYWGLSVSIAGNGFGLSRETLQHVPYTAHSVVEDLEYHLALVKAGYRVALLDNTTVRGDMPTAQSSVDTQRTRWEGGRFRMIAEQVPQLFISVLGGKLRLLEPLLELLLLPLALHISLLLVLLLIPYLATQIYAVLALCLVVLYVLAALKVGGGTWNDVRVLAVAPFYIGWKILLLPRLLGNAGKRAAWVRTERKDKAEKNHD